VDLSLIFSKFGHFQALDPYGFGYVCFCLYQIRCDYPATLLGFTVRTSDNYWQRLIAKHPDIADLEDLVQQALTNPDEIRRSSRDEAVFLFYLARKEKRWVVAVARRLNGDGFLITAYQTDAIKEGETIWRR
jgi:hypothetical protein